MIGVPPCAGSNPVARTIPLKAAKRSPAVLRRARLPVSAVRWLHETTASVVARPALFRQDALAMCISVAGDDRVLYGSDYPHNVGDMKGCLARVDALPAV